MRPPFFWPGLVCAAVLASGVLAAQAQTRPASPSAAAPVAPTADSAVAATAAPSKGELKAQREFKMLDFNGDGQLSRKEVALIPRLSAHFDEADTNHDGFVSYEEVKAFTIKYRAERDRQKALAASAAAANAPAAPSTPPSTTPSTASAAAKP